ncbi:GNAT family N-acetyltransferase [Arthrobacter roseus]|uniref:GNAT family N-acetyltransferase n=1 Tax=Arthrobacter roseus TaxID=136274 RepID=UPI001963C964|nr:GNAT family N-acetyltransferase [Arthrobacter roseus]MBM7849537.1 ribosomal protein S18 acetylase RimI-like enzyme [Arthrobacter roseus]
MNASLDDDLVKVWAAGWAACRGHETREHGRFPSAQISGSSSDWQFFALEPTDDEFSDLASRIAESPSLLYVFTDRMPAMHAKASSAGLHVTGTFQSLMTTDMAGQDIEDPLSPDGFETTVTRGDGVHRVLVTHDGEEAARGSVAVVGEYAVFDRIITAPNYRRQGLGSYVMRALTAVVMEHDVEHGLLLASPDGRALYGFLGWLELTEVLMLQGQEPAEADIVKID